MATTLSPEQARQLWDAGGFAVLTGLPPGSEVGIDGTFYTAKSFSGTKFVPPGLHMVCWTPAASATPSTGASSSLIPANEPQAPIAPVPSALPIRSALLRIWAPRERVALAYDPATEETAPRSVDEAELRALDPQLAAYPFSGLEGWRRLTSAITQEVLKAVPGQVDALTAVEGEDDLEARVGRGAEDEGGKVVAEGAEAKIRLPIFDLRRSWAPGATGEDVSRWAKDKSVLWARVAREYGGPHALIGHLQLSFLLFMYAWSSSSLPAYKRLLTLLCRSPSALAEPEQHYPGDAGGADGARGAVLSLLDTLAAQLTTLASSEAAGPGGVFVTELPGLDATFRDELEELRQGLGHALAVPGWWGMVGAVARAWEGVRSAARLHGWDVGTVAGGDEDEEEEEEGEYAPVVVDVEEEDVE